MSPNRRYDIVSSQDLKIAARRLGEYIEQQNEASQDPAKTGDGQDHAQSGSTEPIVKSTKLLN